MRKKLIACALLSVSFTAAAVASPLKDDDSSALTQARPVSTGYTAPQIAHTAPVNLSVPALAESIPSDVDVVLSINVDENGKPQDVQLVESSDPVLDASVLEAVRQFRWTPAKLDNHAVSADVTLNVVVKH